jgi:hypothetical protein
LALLNWISRSRPQGSLNNSVTVVFDGQEEFFGAHSSSPIQVVFSRGESADDLIKKMAERFASKKSLVIVSNDKDITLYVRALGASVLSVGEFTGENVSRKKTSSLSKETRSSGSKYISLTDQDKINKEFKRIWIDPKS